MSVGVRRMLLQAGLVEIDVGGGRRGSPVSGTSTQIAACSSCLFACEIFAQWASENVIGRLDDEQIGGFLDSTRV
jgi:hypothetical protein